VYPATSYERAADGTYPGGHSYSRDQNPTGDPAEHLLAELEGGAEALLFGSGMAAATALLDALEPGTHVVAPAHMYWTLHLWLQRESERGRLRTSFVANDDPRAWAAAGRRRPGRVDRDPRQPDGLVTDLARSLVAAAGAVVIADNTTATPVLTRPIEHGVDVVFHSATKQLNGHGDVLAGALVTARADDLWARVRDQRAYRGAVLGPTFESWLLLRGMRTLHLRVPRSAASALALAQRLQGHPALVEVIYPGLPDHPGHAVAARQMEGGFGLLVSIRVRGGDAAARRVLDALDLFTDATSLGGTESLVEHRHRIEGVGTPVPPDLLRLAIGLEDPDDLLADLLEALDAESARSGVTGG
jgi:cystathionine gamma-synthase